MEALLTELIPPHDEERIRALHRLDLLYAADGAAFDNFTATLAGVFDAPMAFLSLVDRDTVLYKSQYGPFGRTQVQRRESLCSLTILGTDPLVIEDTATAGFRSLYPFVEVQEGIRFYAGAPLITREGHAIGAVCVVDTRPRSLTDKERSLLTRFAHMALRQIELGQALSGQADFEERLVKSYKELQFVTDTMLQLIWATEPDGYAYFFNKGWLRYTGLSFDEVKGDGWSRSLHPDDRDRTFTAWRRAVDTGGTYDVEYRLRRYDGTYRWFVARGTPMRDETGRILKWYGTTTDIQDQKSAQAALQQSKERFELVSKATQDAIWDWNLLTNEIWWNEGFRELFGYNAEEIEPTIVSWTSRVHPDDKDRVVGGIHDVIDRGGKQWSDEYRFRKKDGSYALVFDRAYALHDENGQPYRMLGSMQDVTLRRRQQQKIKESEQRFEAAVKAVQGVLWTNNAEGHMTGEQPGWAALTGQTLEEYQGYGWARAVHPEDAVASIQAWSEAVQARRTFVFEHRVRTHTGEYRLFSIRAIPLLQPDGSIREWVGVHTDITEQRLAEEKVRESEQRFQNLIREAPVGIVVLTGSEARVDVANAAYGRIIGRQPEELIGKPLFSLLPDSEPTFGPVLEKVRTSGEPCYLYDTPCRVQSPNGIIEGFLNVVYQPHREGSDDTTGVMVLCQDVTAQVLARRQAEEAEETARLAITSAGLGTFHVDLQTNEIMASERLDEIFDVEHSGERERYISAVHPEDQPIRTRAYEKAFTDGLLAYEGRILRKDGSIGWFRVKGRIFFDEQRQPLRLVGVAQDISEEKQFAQELTRQVRERTLELEQFTYVSHHDLQEPLRKILMFTDMVRIDSYHLLGEAARTRLDKISASARRMSTALQDVLNFASLSKVELSVPVNLNEVLAAVQNDLELVIAEKAARIEAQDLPTLHAVPQQMHQLLYNLLNNALKFARPGVPPLIRIRGEKLSETAGQFGPKNYVRITVADNGIGFDPGAAEKIFVLFQRLHNRDAYAGTGIGLALCRKVVSNHGGQISAEGRPGEGAIFTIDLPEQPLEAWNGPRKGGN